MLRKIVIGPVVVLGYFVLRFNCFDGFKLFFQPLSPLSNTEPLEVRGVAASIKMKQ